MLTPILEWDSKAFSFMMDYAKKQSVPAVIPNEGDTLRFGGATVTILHCWPEGIDCGRTNGASIVLRIDYGNTSFLFTGDAEDLSEYMMIDAGVDLRADVLKVAHHGSRYSSTEEFLNAVSPAYAIISCGKNNQYDHPHAETLERLEAVGAMILRTDELGTIILKSDGESVSGV